MDNTIIRTRDFEERTMFIKAVYGLNIFVVNKQAVDVEHDPRVTFMRIFCDDLYRVAHVGDVALEGDNAEKYFTPQVWNSQHIISHVGLYNEAFYASSYHNGYVFFGIQDTFWTTQIDKERSGGVNYLIGADAFAMYAHRDASQISLLVALLEQPLHKVQVDALQKPLVIDDWIDRITTIFDYCIVTVADGWHTLIYSRHEINDSLVQKGIVAAAQTITASDWYASNKKDLRWEDEFTKSMVTPNIMERYTELKLRHTEQDRSSQ